MNKTNSALRALLACGVAVSLLAACGGSDNSSTTTPTSPTPTPTPVPTSSVALQPLASGNQYVGTISFGDTISVVIDSPAAGQATLTFLDSQFGLSGALTGKYAANSDGSFSVSGLTASSNAPAALSANLAQITLRYSIQDGVLSGSLGNVPNVTANDGSLLQGHLTASNNGVTSVAALAGTYSFVRLSGNYSKKGVPTGDQDAAAGQIKINADGSFRVCNGHTYSDTCTNLDLDTGKQVVDAGTITPEADQKTWPGGLVASSGGKRLGRLFASVKNGQTTLMLDQAGTNSDGTLRTGSWVLTTSKTLAQGAQNGEWLCSEPQVSDNNVITGRTQLTYARFADNQLLTDANAATTTLAYNAAPVATSAAAFSITNGVNGLIAGTWTGTVNGQTRTAALAFLPVNATTIYYLDEVNGNGFFVQGTCHALPAETTDSTYLNAKAGDILQIKLSDVHPTQPAIGYDQIYYKQAKYTSKASKALDDLCAASSGDDNDGSKAITGVTGRVDDSSTFTCKKTTGSIPAGMKTVVIGPKGKLFLTDGHHTFTSLYEWANGNGGLGGNVKPYVVVNANLSGKSYAEFWQTMRQNNWVWLKDINNQAISPADLPPALGLKNGLANDAWRGLIYFTRDIGYTPPINAPEFLEFYWEEYLRGKMNLASYNLNDVTSYLQAVHDASAYMVALAPTDIASGGKTAAALGGLTLLNETNFTALGLPVSNASPGKLPMAVNYRLTH